MLPSELVLPAKDIPPNIFHLKDALAGAASKLKVTIVRKFEDERFHTAPRQNVDGDDQKPLYFIANKTFIEAISETNFRWYASEECKDIEVVDPNGVFAITIDPLDGSSSIDINAPVGTIFSVFPAVDDPDKSFLRPASQQIAAGNFISGPQTILMLTHGSGVCEQVLNPDTATFIQTQDRLIIPKQSTEFAINMSNYRHWSKPVKAFIDDCIAGEEGPRASDFNMRWIASLVAEAHRISTRGGVFLYSGDSREGYHRRSLRMVYECAPVAFLIEQAGGGAIDGSLRILTSKANYINERTPFIFGSLACVDCVAAYHELPDHEVSALFVGHGLFKA